MIENKRETINRARKFSRCSSYIYGLLLFLHFLLPVQAAASHPGIAACDPDSVIYTDLPSRKVAVTILRIKPNSDMEGDDDYVPFYDNHADIYGKVTIDGETFSLPEVSDSDYPHWEDVTVAEHPEMRYGKFVKDVSGSAAAINIAIKENDWGITGDNDSVDVNPVSGKSDLDMVFDLCSLLITGDISRESQAVFSVSGGSTSDAATLYMKVEMVEGRPDSAGDLALMDADIVQVIPQTNRLIAGKPTVLRLRLANNFDIPVSTELAVNIEGPCFSRTDAFPINLDGGEVKKIYLYTDSPLILPACSGPYPLGFNVAIDPDGSYSHYPPGDCRLSNNEFHSKIDWKVISAVEPTLLWSKVGTLLDIGNLTPDSQFETIMEIGQPFIKATYPVVNVHNVKSYSGIVPPLTASYDWLSTVVSVLGIPADCVTPFTLVFELNGVSTMMGYDRLMGVLPNRDWFKRFGSTWGYNCWSDVTGLSMGEFGPHAVIFLPENPGSSAPAMTLPAHELGHTFGLSTDSRLKGWLCNNTDFPALTTLLCAIDGGFDEYNHSEDALKSGNPASGYWVTQGDEPASLLSMVNKEQCDSHCLMGNSPSTTLPATDPGRWIDPPDYDHIVDKLSLTSDPEVIYVSGMISARDEVYLGYWFHMTQGMIDRDSTQGLYGFRFLGHDGSILQDVGLPLNWNTSTNMEVPVTFFGLNLPYPQGARTVEVWNRKTKAVLATREISLNAPLVKIKRVFLNYFDDIVVSWNGYDADGDKLTYTVAIGQDGQNGLQWWPIAYQIEDQQLVLNSGNLPSGTYTVKVIASDGIHVRESKRVRFNWGKGQ